MSPSRSGILFSSDWMFTMKRQKWIFLYDGTMERSTSFWFSAKDFSLAKNLLALHLYLYPCITITNTCYTTSKLSWSHCSIRVNHHLLKGLGACYLDIMVDCSDKFCNFTVVFKVGKYQSWTIWFQIYSVEVVYHLSIISSNFKYFKIEASEIFTQDWNFSYLGILWNLHWNELQVISLPN